MKKSSLSILPLINCMTLVACSSCISTPSQTSIIPIVPSVTTSSTTNTYSGDLLGITFEYPSGWYLKDVPEEPFDMLLTSFDPESPPHKLEWDDTTVSIGIRRIPPELASDSLETWIQDTKQEAEKGQLSIFAENRLVLETGFPAAQITVVSGTGGILEYVFIALNGRQFEIIAQGNFVLAKVVLDTLRPIH